VGSFPFGIAITPDGKTAYVTNLVSNSVTPIDVATNMPGAEIKVGSGPEGIAITPDGRTAYVANSGRESVTPIDVATNKPGTEIKVGSRPEGIAITPDGKTAYDVNGGSNSVTPIDVATNTPGAEIKVGSFPFGIAITPPAAPVVASQAASALTQSSAQLNGLVNPNGGLVGECRFEYGTTTAYGKSAPCSASPGSGTSPVAVSAPIAGLAPNTTYHFRISATNAGGMSKGSDAMFTTPEVNAPTVGTMAASANTQTSATLNASVNPEGAEVSECKFEYGTTTSYGSSASCSPPPGSGGSPVAVSASVTGLAANTTYHFRISATNARGTSKGSDRSFTTLPNPPTVVTELASSITHSSATLNATVNPNGAEVSECKFELATTTAYGFTVPCSSLPGKGESPVAVSAQLTLGQLAPSTTYHFRISATNGGGMSTGSDRTFGTLPLPAATPQPPALTPQLPAVAPQPPAVGRQPPAITAASLTNGRFRVARQATAISAAKAPLGTSFHFTLSAAAKLQITITRSAAGLQHGQRCLAPSAELTRAHAKRCTRTLTLGALTRASEPAGGDSVAFSGRIGSRALSAGTYAALLLASNDAGRSEPVKLGFVIVRG
jgi:YVTN family beta-propeller protein